MYLLIQGHDNDPQPHESQKMNNVHILALTASDFWSDQCSLASDLEDAADDAEKICWSEEAMFLKQINLQDFEVFDGF